jgi:hypothetical protein
MEATVEFCCPSCLQHSAVTIDRSQGRQRFVEDCQSCCEPIVDVETREGELARELVSP